MDSELQKTEFILPDPYHLGRTLWWAGMGNRDPTLHVSAEVAKLGFHTPAGAVDVRVQAMSGIGIVTTHGPGGDWLQSRLEGLLGLNDHPEEFQPTGKVGELQRKFPGGHLPRLPVLFPRLVQIVLQQLVSFEDALHSWQTVVQRFGVESPSGMVRLPPSAKTLSQLGYADLVDCHIMPRQARLVLQLAREARRIERLAEDNVDALGTYLQGIPGIGPWTVQHVLGSSCGKADAVMTGDYGLPHSVAWFLTGKERSDDDEMLRLLKPYAGHRFRVISLLMQNGIEAPRRGPRMRNNRWRFTRR